MTPHASLPSQLLTPKFQSLCEELLDILPSTVNTVREAASRVKQTPNVVASNPTDDSYEEIQTQAGHQIKGMSIADPKRPGVHEPQEPHDISHIQREDDMQLGRKNHLAYQKGMNKSL